MYPSNASSIDNGMRDTRTRRQFLGTAAGFAAGSAAFLAAGCAAPPPPQEFDPSSLVYPPPPEQPRFYYDRTIWGSNDVIEETSQDRFRRFATGESARGQGFAKPFGVAVQEGRVFVSDTVARQVHAFDYPRKRYYAIGQRGVGRLAKPLGMDVDASGRLFVVDGTAKRVIVYDLEGNYVTALGVNDELVRPTAVAVTPQADRIYVLDTGGVRSQSHRVVVFNLGGDVVQTIGQRGAGEGEFNLPLDCCLGPDMSLYVLDTGNFRVQIFSPDGVFQREFGEAGRFPGQFGHPKGIAVDAEGKIYISDTSFGVFQIFDSEARILMSVGQRNESDSSPGNFLLPAGIGVDVDNRIYVVEQFYRKVEVFRPVGTPADWPVGQRVAA